MHPYTKQLLASVPQLHRKWADVEAELAALETAGGDGRAASGVAIGAGPTLIEVEDEHYVAPVEAETNGASA
jgi:peptide/nickel transport system ATP-binding protein